MIELINLYKQMERIPKIKKCFYPETNNCNGKIKRAHAIQNNKILINISDNGELIALNGKSNLFFQNCEKQGRKIASTFWGFCDYHDTIVFEPIENYDYDKSLFQTFLYTYRTFIWHYYLKETQMNKNNFMRENVNLDLKSNEFFIGTQLGIVDNEKLKTKFDNAILNRKYDIINFYVWEIPFKVEFSCCSMVQLFYDLLGNEINNYNDIDDINKPLKNLFINIFPENNKSYCIFSWVNDDNEYQEFARQFSKLTIKNKINYLNNMLPKETDKIFINPKLWKKWGESTQQAFIEWANISIIFDAMYNEKLIYRKWKYAYTPWNLFDCSEKLRK